MTNEAKAVELFHQDGRAAGVWYCSECRAVYLQELQAAACHQVFICECGAPVDPVDARSFHRKCRACQSADWDRKMKRDEAERFEAAVKLSPAEYDGPVYAEGVGPEWFESLDEYREYIEDDDVTQARYLWAVNNTGMPRVTTQHVTESLLDEMWEDADESDLNGIQELSAALDAFNEANKSVANWRVDYSRAIVLETPDAR